MKFSPQQVIGICALMQGGVAVQDFIPLIAPLVGVDPSSPTMAIVHQLGDVIKAGDPKAALPVLQKLMDVREKESADTVDSLVQCPHCGQVFDGRFDFE